jgi:hypothetical protein
MALGRGSMSPPARRIYVVTVVSLPYRTLHVLTVSHLNQVPLEKLYDELGPVKYYDRRSKWVLNHRSTPFLTTLVVFGERVPPKVTHVSQAHLTASTIRSKAMCGMLRRRLGFRSNL